VHFPNGRAGEIREKQFVGPLGRQLREALAYIHSAFIGERVLKHPGRAEADRFMTFPYAAVEEALANAVYHRGYDVREPVEVQVTPDEMVITSYPGPDISIRMDDLNQGGVVARRYRNRRVGEFLKELRLTEGRGTGVPSIIKAMRDNGSPPPRFLTDDRRTYFSTVLPVHPLVRREADVAAPRDADLEMEFIFSDLLRAEPRRMAVLRLSLTPQRRSSLQHHLGLADARHFRRTYLRPLIKAGLIAPTNPENPHAPNQQYQTTARGRALLDQYPDTSSFE
jgi:ATP-dependent DNA helicase RecG